MKRFGLGYRSETKPDKKTIAANAANEDRILNPCTGTTAAQL
jgi:hypothetical protein